MSFTGLSQSDIEHPTGRRFLKRVEYNTYASGVYNIDSKTDTEKLFFGDFNAMVEFFILPSFEGAYGFRVFKDSLNKYVIENKRIVNWDTVMSQVQRKFPSISIKSDKISSTSKEEMSKIIAHNKEMWNKQQEERLNLYKIESQSFPVSNKFAEKLHETIVAVIYNFSGKGKPLGILDGYRVIFRCVVEDEVWTFNIQNPVGEIERLTDICQRIIKHSVNESEYIELLNNIHLFFDKK
jgi:hypothetical protein